MNLHKEFEKVFGILNSNKTKEEKISFFLEKLQKDAEKIRKAKHITLCGATPFAKKVLNNKNLLFSNNINVTIEDFEQNRTNIRGGGEREYIYSLFKT